MPLTHPFQYINYASEVELFKIDNVNEDGYQILQRIALQAFGVSVKLSNAIDEVKVSTPADLARLLYFAVPSPKEKLFFDAIASVLNNQQLIELKKAVDALVTDALPTIPAFRHLADNEIRKLELSVLVDTETKKTRDEESIGLLREKVQDMPQFALYETRINLLIYLLHLKRESINARLRWSTPESVAKSKQIGIQDHDSDYVKQQKTQILTNHAALYNAKKITDNTDFMIDIVSDKKHKNPVNDDTIQHALTGLTNLVTERLEELSSHFRLGRFSISKEVEKPQEKDALSVILSKLTAIDILRKDNFEPLSNNFIAATKNVQEPIPITSDNNKSIVPSSINITPPPSLITPKLMTIKQPSLSTRTVAQPTMPLTSPSKPDAKISQVPLKLTPTAKPKSAVAKLSRPAAPVSKWQAKNPPLVNTMFPRAPAPTSNNPGDPSAFQQLPPPPRAAKPK